MTAEHRYASASHKKPLFVNHNEIPAFPKMPIFVFHRTIPLFPTEQASAKLYDIDPIEKAPAKAYTVLPNRWHKEPNNRGSSPKGYSSRTYPLHLLFPEHPQLPIVLPWTEPPFLQGLMLVS